MFVTLVGTLFALGLAVLIVVIVAAPEIISGTRLLTPQGEQLTRDARARLARTPVVGSARTDQVSGADSSQDLDPIQDGSTPTVPGSADGSLSASANVVIDVRDSDAPIDEDEIAGRVARAVQARNRATNSQDAQDGLGVSHSERVSATIAG